MRFEKPPAQGTKQLHSHVPERGLRLGAVVLRVKMARGVREGWGSTGPSPLRQGRGSITALRGMCEALPRLPSQSHQMGA